jgi:hypothetical protein
MRSEFKHLNNGRSQIVGIEPIRAKKRHTSAEFGQPCGHTPAELRTMPSQSDLLGHSPTSGTANSADNTGNNAPNAEAARSAQDHNCTAIKDERNARRFAARCPGPALRAAAHWRLAPVEWSRPAPNRDGSADSEDELLSSPGCGHNLLWYSIRLKTSMVVGDAVNWERAL